MVATLDHVRCQRIARRLDSPYAHDRVATALFEAVVQGLEFGPRDLPLAEDREWIRGIVAVPLQQATNAALQALVSSVSQALERAPNHFLDRYEERHHLQELGIE